MRLRFSPFFKCSENIKEQLAIRRENRISKNQKSMGLISFFEADELRLGGTNSPSPRPVFVFYSHQESPPLKAPNPHHDFSPVRGCDGDEAARAGQVLLQAEHGQESLAGFIKSKYQLLQHLAPASPSL